MDRTLIQPQTVDLAGNILHLIVQRVGTMPTSAQEPSGGREIDFTLGIQAPSRSGVSVALRTTAVVSYR
jgi:hypothetical protein